MNPSESVVTASRLSQVRSGSKDLLLKPIFLQSR